jgi:hypothetical protein
MSRKKAVSLSLVVVCVIGAITALVVNQREEPKNVFEEMYYAEMDAAEMNSKLAEGQTKQKTPLSNTEYFDEVSAEYLDYRAKEFKEVTVKEAPKEASPFTFSAVNPIHMHPKSPFGQDPRLTQKIVKIESKFLYSDVNIEMNYGYLLFSEGTLEPLYGFSLDKGLHISFVGTVEGNELNSFEDFQTIGVSETELKERITQDLEHILNYWVDNYRESKFKHGEFGEYEIVGSSRFSMKDRMNEWRKHVR